MDEELRREVRTEDTDVEIMSMRSGIMRADKFTQEDDRWAEDSRAPGENINN